MPSGSERCTHDSRLPEHASINQSLAFYTGVSWIGMLVWDLIKSLDFLRGMPEVDHARTAIVGVEEVGIGAIIASLFREWVQLPVGVFCGMTYRGLAEHTKEEPLLLPKGFIPKLLNYGDLDDIYAMRAPKPLALIHTRNDPRMPEESFGKVQQHLKRVYAKAGQGAAERLVCVSVDSPELVRSHNHEYESHEYRTNPHPLWGPVLSCVQKQFAGDGAGAPVPAVASTPSRRNIGYTKYRGSHIYIRDDNAFSTLYRSERKAAECLNKYSLEARGIELPRDVEKLRKEYVELVRGPAERCALNPVVARTWSEEGLSYEYVYFHSETQSVVSAILVRDSKNVGAALPTMIVHPGWGEPKEDYLPAGRRFAREGYCAFVMDPRGQGERIIGAAPSGSTSTLHPFERESVITAGFSWVIGRPYHGMFIWDISRAIDYLQSRKDIAGDRIGLTGLCMGGFCSWFGGAYDQRIKVTVPICCNSTYEAFLLFAAGHHFPSLIHVFHDIAKWGDFPELGALIAPRPLLLFSNSEDNWFPLVGTQDLVARVKEIYRKCGSEDRFEYHLETGPHHYIDRYAKTISAFLKRWL
jgi:dienelactone hydrolase